MNFTTKGKTCWFGENLYYVILSCLFTFDVVVKIHGVFHHAGNFPLVETFNRAITISHFPMLLRNIRL